MEAAGDVRTRDDLQQGGVVGELPRAEALAEVGVEVDGGHSGILLDVRDSRIHGRGVFALTPIEEGSEVIEYTGELITWDEASERYAASDAENGHTFFFDVGDDMVLDGGVGGNDSRWINHSCDPNCEFELEERRVVVRALRDIPVGQELLLDYRLEVDETDDLEHYACRCGAPTCRGTMAAPA